MLYKITFSNEPFTGTYMNISFVDGVGRTDSDYLAERFRKKGLLVEKVEDKKPPKRKVENETD